MCCYFVVIEVATYIIARYVTKKMYFSGKQSLAFSLFYTMIPFSNAFLGVSSFSLATHFPIIKCFFPLFCYALFQLKESNFKTSKFSLPLMTSFAIFIITNIAFTVLISFIVLCLVFVLRKEIIKHLLYFIGFCVKNIFGILVLSSAFVLPFIRQYLVVHPTGAVAFNIVPAKISDSLDLAIPAFVLTLLVVTGIINIKKKFISNKIFVSVSVVVVLFCSRLIPWELMNYIPILDRVQFIERLRIIPYILVIYLMTLVWSRLNKKTFIYFLIFSLIACFATNFVAVDSDDVPTNNVTLFEKKKSLNLNNTSSTQLDYVPQDSIYNRYPIFRSVIEQTNSTNTKVIQKGTLLDIKQKSRFNLKMVKYVNASYITIKTDPELLYNIGLIFPTPPATLESGRVRLELDLPYAPYYEITDDTNKQLTFHSSKKGKLQIDITHVVEEIKIKSLGNIVAVNGERTKKHFGVHQGYYDLKFLEKQKDIQIDTDLIYSADIKVVDENEKPVIIERSEQGMLRVLHFTGKKLKVTFKTPKWVKLLFVFNVILWFIVILIAFICWLRQWFRIRKNGLPPEPLNLFEKYLRTSKTNSQK